MFLGPSAPRRRARRGGIVALALSLGIIATVVPSAAAAAGSGPRERRLAPLGSAQASLLQLRSEARAMAREGATRAELADFARRSLAALSGVPVDEHYEEEEEIVAVPTGDLDGDGSADLLEYEFSYGDGDLPTTAITALKGSTGKQLWRRSFGRFKVALSSDALDQAPGDDLLFIDVVDVSYAAVYEWRIGYSAANGRSASELWRTEYRNVFGEAGAYAGGVYAAAYTDLNFVLPYAVADDLDGDSAADVVLIRFDYAAADTPVVYGGAFRVGFEALSGKTGASLLRLDPLPLTDYFDLAVVPDLDGDGAQDVATLLYEEATERLFLEAHSGKGTKRWSVRLGEDEFPYISGGEVNGDGKGDVLLNDVRFSVRSGANGARLWSFEASGFGVPVGNVDGAAGSEILLMEDEFFDFEIEAGSSDSEEGSDLEEGSTTTARLLAGSSGVALWSASAPGSAYPTGDLDGDDIDDGVFVKFNEDESTDSYTVDYRFFSGRDGVFSWAITEGENEYLFDPDGDLDGDGGNDLGLLFFTGPESYVALDGSSGDRLWDAPAVPGGYLFYTPMAADLDAALAGAELVDNGYSDDEGFYSATRSGATGTEVWRRKSRDRQ